MNHLPLLQLLRLLSMFSLIVASTTARAAQADTGMITALTGNATLTSAGKPRAAAALLKFASSDNLTLTGSARVQLVYFDSGRQENFQGPGRIDLGTRESKSTLRVEITQLPPLVINQLSRTPVGGQQGSVGMVRFRGGPNLRAIELLQQQYNELKAGARPDDLTPELFLLSGLHEQNAQSQLKAKLAALEREPRYQTLVTHFQQMIEPAKSSR